MWIPGYQKVDLGPDGGVFDETQHPKVCLHTTEGSSLEGAEIAYKSYPPHIGYDPVRRIRRQYVSLSKHSYSLKGGESDDEYIIQVEIVGFARETHNWPVWIYQNIAMDVVKPLEDLLKVPRIYLRFHGADEGIVLASKDSPIRLTNSELRSFSGWLGHQHIPSPDTHWDPGRFLINKCFDHLNSLFSVDQKKELDMSVRLQRGDSTGLDPNGAQWGSHVYMVKYDPQLPGGAVRVHMTNNAVYRSLLKAQKDIDVLPQADLDAIPKVEEL